MKKHIFARPVEVVGHLPETVLDNQALHLEHPEWSINKVFAKTGIASRHIAAPGETALDLGEAAARKLFANTGLPPEEVGALIFCTQSPDYALPPNTCLLQKRLDLPRRVMAFDFHHGCSGYVYGVSLAKALIESGQADNVLLVTAETYSKYLAPGDHVVRTIFGDAGAATFFRAEEADNPFLEYFIFNTDGNGAGNLIVPAGGQRTGYLDPVLERAVLADGLRGLGNLYMNGPEIFLFTLNVVPELLQKILEQSGRSQDDIDLFVFHQANKFMLDHLAKKCGLPQERFYIYLEEVGNTVSCSIPLALEQARTEGRLKNGETAIILGFGVGYSSAGGLLRF